MVVKLISSSEISEEYEKDLEAAAVANVLLMAKDNNWSKAQLRAYLSQFKAIPEALRKAVE